eukprot:765762-Hanusia_phi.AAC.1
MLQTSQSVTTPSFSWKRPYLPARFRREFEARICEDARMCDDGRGWARMCEDGRGWARMGEDVRGCARMCEDV